MADIVLVEGNNELNVSLIPLALVGSIGISIINVPEGAAFWRYALWNTEKPDPMSGEICRINEISYRTPSDFPIFLAALYIWNESPQGYPANVIYLMQSIHDWADDYKPPLWMNEPGLYEYNCLEHALKKIGE